MKTVSSWGRTLSAPHHTVVFDDPGKIPNIIADNPLPGLAYGMGRSYGDSCLNPNGTLWLTRGLDHFIVFDEHKGILVCEAGVLLRDIQRLVVPRGWMLPVTPGTQLITVGGAIANDVHGKNHHAFGSFSDHVSYLELVRTNGETIKCGPDLNPEWFAATAGGLGLTGVISQVGIQLRRIAGDWLETETIPFSNLKDFFQLDALSVPSWEHTVSWIDCLSREGRGLYMRGNFTDTACRQNPETSSAITVPFTLPFSPLNKHSLSLFNKLYYALKKRKTGRQLAYYESFFYPLDNLLEWNKMYGPNGFFQYQSVVPLEAGEDATRAMLDEIARAGQGSFLAVLKTFGKRNAPGMLSFPRPGVTLALDFPNRNMITMKLFTRLDAIVREARGAVYPAKDARMPRDLFEAGFPRLNEFLTYRDPGISSAMSRRLMDY